MLGPSHAATSLAAGALTLPFAPVHDVLSQIAWTLVVGGCGYLPDLDGPGATAARCWGPVTGLYARLVGLLAGGHRNRTHDVVIGTGFFVGLVWMASINRWTSIAIVSLAIGLAIEAVGRFLPGDWKSPGLNFAFSVTLGYTLIHGGYDWSWLPWATALGVLVHIAGDAVTTMGIPVPLTTLGGRKRNWGPRLFDAGHPIEKPITWASFALCIAGFVAFSVWPHFSKLILGA